MTPEFNFHLKIKAENIDTASSLRNFLLRINGVEEITPLDQFKISIAQGCTSLQTFIDLTTPVGEVIKAWREERQMRAIDLVRIAGNPITKGYLSQLENNGIKKPGPKHLSTIANALGVSVEDIMSRRMPAKKTAHQEDKA